MKHTAARWQSNSATLTRTMLNAWERRSFRLLLSRKVQYTLVMCTPPTAYVTKRRPLHGHARWPSKTLLCQDTTRRKCCLTGCRTIARGLHVSGWRQAHCSCSEYQTVQNGQHRCCDCATRSDVSRHHAKSDELCASFSRRLWSTLRFFARNGHLRRRNVLKCLACQL